MSRHCAVSGCSNGDYKLNKWKKSHSCMNQSCECDPPFRLFPFPTEKKEKESRRKWLQLINRLDSATNNCWVPGKQSRVCSDHFIDGYQTKENPFPSERYPNQQEKLKT